MADQITHLEQYKMLRAEIMQSIRVLDTVQYAAALGTAGIYTWLIVNKAQVTLELMWFIPFGLLLFCAAKSWDLNNRIWQVAKYLERLEDAAFGDDPQIPGWERYKRNNKLTLYDRVLFAATALAWLIALIGSFALSWYLSK